MASDCLYKSILGKVDRTGKTLPLWVHLKDTAATIAYLCKKRIPMTVIQATELTKEDFIKVAVFLAMVHDIGKCTPLFASKLVFQAPFCKEQLNVSGLNIPDYSLFVSAGKSPHAIAGSSLLEKFLCPDGICSVVGAHHGKPVPMIACTVDQLETYPYNYFADTKEIWGKLQSHFFEEALHTAGYESVHALPVLSNCAQMLLSGLLIEADWIASNTEYFPLFSEMEQDTNIEERFEKAVNSLAFPDMWSIENLWEGSDNFYYARFGFLPNSMQKKVADIIHETTMPGLMIIEAQMGTGKTEAALAAAEIIAGKAGSGGIFMGLPTQATSNGIFPRLEAWAAEISGTGRHSIRLVHGMAELNEDYQSLYHGTADTGDEEQDGLMVHSWFSGKKQALLADFVVGTVDTALMSALQQKHVMLRHLGLCSKVVIIDECHAYDAYMSRFLDRMLQWLGAYHVPVVLLSATLPLERKEKMIKAYMGQKNLELSTKADYPLITWTDGENINSKAVISDTLKKEVKIHRITDENIISDLRKNTENGGCAGVIVNTVKRAQAISKQLREAFPEKRVFLYHAQFLAEERSRREKELIAMIGKKSVKESRNHVIIVGTQVLEQSLDIDFDYLISDLCPMDLLLQRIGRLHRHERIRPKGLDIPMCAVVYSENEYEKGAVNIYGEWLLKQTSKTLSNKIVLPDDIPELVERVYMHPEKVEDADYQRYRDYESRKEGRAEPWLLGPPKHSRREMGNSISGMLDLSINSEKRAEASVRDGSPSIDVLVMRKLSDGKIGYLPWISQQSLRSDTVPSSEEGKKIAVQRIRLPFMLCCGEKGEQIISELEKENASHLSMWQQSPWLNGELVLLLDENCERSLCGYQIHYYEESGLLYKEVLDGEGV